MQRPPQASPRRSPLPWVGLYLMAVAVAMLVGHLLGPHSHSHAADMMIPAAACHTGHDDDHDPGGHDDGESACGYLLPGDSGVQPATGPAVAIVTVADDGHERGADPTGSAHDSRAPPDLMSELQVIRV